ncbi:MAG: tetratricopeptide repeat protein [Candidatus Ratteibacteria bacterium]|jgi:tetratricopeptide (TPR) repeat protein
MTVLGIARRGRRAISVGIVIIVMAVTPSFAEEPSNPSQERARFIQSIPDIVKEISPTVVRFLLYDKKNILVEEGNGFFLNEEGEVVTSAQMLRSAYRAEIRVSNGRRYPVKYILAEDLFGEGIIVSADIPKESITVASFTKKSLSHGEEVVLPAIFSDSSKSGKGMIFPVKNIIDTEDIFQGIRLIPRELCGTPVATMQAEIFGVATLFSSGKESYALLIPISRIVRFPKKKSFTEWKILSKEETSIKKGLNDLLKNRYDDAIEIFSKEVKRDPNNAIAHYALAITYDTRKKYSAALASYIEAVRINPDNAIAYYSLGMLYGKQHRYHEEIESYKKAIRINPEYVEAHYSLGLAYTTVRNHAAAMHQSQILQNLDRELAESLRATVHHDTH